MSFAIWFQTIFSPSLTAILPATLKVITIPYTYHALLGLYISTVFVFVCIYPLYICLSLLFFYSPVWNVLLSLENYLSIKNQSKSPFSDKAFPTFLKKNVWLLLYMLIIAFTTSNLPHTSVYIHWTVHQFCNVRMLARHQQAASTHTFSEQKIGPVMEQRIIWRDENKERETKQDGRQLRFHLGWCQWGRKCIENLN